MSRSSPPRPRRLSSPPLPLSVSAALVPAQPVVAGATRSFTTAEAAPPARRRAAVSRKDGEGASWRHRATEEGRSFFWDTQRCSQVGHRSDRHRGVRDRHRRHHSTTAPASHPADVAPVRRGRPFPAHRALRRLLRGPVTGPVAGPVTGPVTGPAGASSSAGSLVAASLLVGGGAGVGGAAAYTAWHDDDSPSDSGNARDSDHLEGRRHAGHASRGRQRPGRGREGAAVGGEDRVATPRAPAPARAS